MKSFLSTCSLAASSLLLALSLHGCKDEEKTDESQQTTTQVTTKPPPGSGESIAAKQAIYGTVQQQERSIRAMQVWDWAILRFPEARNKADCKVFDDVTKKEVDS